jgi:hypothetical protein
MYTDLSGANLSEADLNNANLLSANLNGAILNSAKAGADFRLADLRRANLIGVDLNAAKLNWANLTESVLDPSAIGDASGFLSVKGLSEIRIENVSSIVELRKKMKEASFTFEEKALTSALRKYQLRYPDYYPVFNLEYWFEGLLLGGFLTDFGAFPEGAFDALIILIFVFFWFYLFALMRPKVKAGIWRLRPSDRIIKEKNESDRELIKWNGLCQTVLTALYFSFLSAFHFGWRELNVSNWIVRIQSKEYTLRATGWVRTVSGIQSLISLYLVALSLLTYFGRPFE